ncbi:hypothetical protein EV426DRAFT_625402, partial [Tirmania nivea]
MAQELCTKGGSCSCKGKCISWTQDYQDHQQATVASDQPQALSSEKRLSISSQGNIGGSGSTTQQNTDAPGQPPTSTSRLQCPYCPNKQFGERSKLNDHMRSHPSVRSFSCPKCSNKYKYQRDLVHHLKTKCKLGGVYIPSRPRPSYHGLIPIGTTWGVGGVGAPQESTVVHKV